MRRGFGGTLLILFTQVFLKRRKPPEGEKVDKAQNDCNFIPAICYRRANRARVPYACGGCRAMHLRCLFPNAPAAYEAYAGHQTLNYARLGVEVALHNHRGNQDVTTTCYGDKRERPKPHALSGLLSIQGYR